MIIEQNILLFILWFAGAGVSFLVTAYARALQWSIPRLAFLVWPLLIVAFPFWLLYYAHSRLENYIRGQIPASRLKTSRVRMDDYVEVSERMRDG